MYSKTLFFVFLVAATLLPSRAEACGTGGFCGAGSASFSLNLQINGVRAPYPVQQNLPYYGPYPGQGPVYNPSVPPYQMGGHGFYQGGHGMYQGGFQQGGHHQGYVRVRVQKRCGHRGHGGGCRQKRCGHRRMKCCGSKRRGGSWAVNIGIRGRRGGFIGIHASGGRGHRHG